MHQAGRLDADLRLGLFQGQGLVAEQLSPGAMNWQWRIGMQNQFLHRQPAFLTDADVDNVSAGA